MSGFKLTKSFSLISTFLIAFLAITVSSFAYYKQINDSDGVGWWNFATSADNDNVVVYVDTKLVELDADGNVTGTQIKITPDRNWIPFLEKQYFAFWDAIVKFNLLTGIKEWEKTFSQFSITGIKELSNKKAIVLARDDTSKLSFIAKIDESGNPLWQKVLPEGDYELNSVFEYPSGELFIIGEFKNNFLGLGNVGSIILKMNSQNGTISKAIALSSLKPGAITASNDGHILMVFSVDPPGTSGDVIMKLNSLTLDIMSQFNMQILNSNFLSLDGIVSKFTGDGYILFSYPESLLVVADNSFASFESFKTTSYDFKIRGLTKSKNKYFLYGYTGYPREAIVATVEQDLTSDCQLIKTNKSFVKNVTNYANADISAFFASTSDANIIADSSKYTLNASNELIFSDGICKQQTADLYVYKGGSGNGTVTSNPPGINCGTDCFETYPAGTTVTLTATPDSGSVFSTWMNDCQSCNSNSVCTIIVDTLKSCTAIFSQQLNQHTITTSANPAAGGSVSCSPNPVNYGSTSICTITINPGYTLQSVGGTCGGTLSGNTYTTNPVTADCTVQANFSTNQYTLTVTKAGTGSGTVTSNPAGINCGTDCSEIYPASTTVTLTATPDTNSVFTGWSGDADCSDGVVTMNADILCIATFTTTQQQTHTITTSVIPQGAGNILCNPNPVSHGSTSTCIITANANYVLNNVSGTCDGNLNGNTYTTNPVTADCTIEAMFVKDAHIIVIPDNVNFNKVPVGKSENETISILNPGDTEVDVNVTLYDSNNVFAINKQSLTVDAQSAETITVTFTPSLKKIYTAFIVVKTDKQQIIINLTGEGADELISEFEFDDTDAEYDSFSCVRILNNMNLNGSSLRCINWAGLGGAIKFEFDGYKIAVRGNMSPHGGLADIYIDFVYQGTINTFSASSIANVSLFERTLDKQDRHVLIIVPTATWTGKYIEIDSFVVKSKL